MFLVDLIDGTKHSDVVQKETIDNRLLWTFGELQLQGLPEDKAYELVTGALKRAINLSEENDNSPRAALQKLLKSEQTAAHRHS
jgi:hypothetical protein